jgi:hypothetical protein
MKTLRNRRKTTTGRRRRVIKQQRVQTRIHHRKETVSSGRRHKFFKRGGEPFPNTRIFDTETSRQFGTYAGNKGNNSIYLQTLQQNQKDRIDRDNAGADQAARYAAQEAAILNYPEVDQFVQKIKTIFVSRQFFGDTVTFGIQKLPQKTFEYREVQNGNSQVPVTIKLDHKTVKFYISHSGRNFYIYVDDTLYGQLQIILNGNHTTDSFEPLTINAIKIDLYSST